MKRRSNRLFELCTSIPPIKPKTLLPVFIMLCAWIILRIQGVAEDTSFVVAVVSAQAYLVWRNLPIAAANLNTISRPKTRLLCIVTGITLFVVLLQLWLSSPLFTQRLLTAMAVLFLVIMVLGIARERDVMDKVNSAIPSKEDQTAPVSLLRVNAAVAVLVIAMNEWLIYSESPAVWITVMPLFMLILHGVYWLLVLMTLPPDSGEPA